MYDLWLFGVRVSGDQVRQIIINTNIFSWPYDRWSFSFNNGNIVSR